MQEPEFKIEMVSGSVEVQTTWRPCVVGGAEGMEGLSRKIVRNQIGSITEISDWEPTGVKMYWPEPEPCPWWKFWN